MTSPLISAIAPGALGFLAMAALGWHLASSASQKTIEETASPEEIPQNHKRPQRPQRADSLAAAQMRAIRDAGSPAERLRTVVALANSLAPSEFPAWAEGDRFNFRKGPELDVFRMIIFERWIKEDPASLIPWAIQNNYGQAGRALIAMAKDDPQRLIDHCRTNPNAKDELQILDEVAKKHPALALQRLQDLSAAGLPSETLRLAKSLLVELAKSSPAALEATLESLPVDLRREAESALSGQRLITSFSAEIRALWDHPDGWRIFQSNLSGNGELGTKMLAQIADFPESWKARVVENYYHFINSENSKDWFNADLEGKGFSASQAKRIKESSLNELASSDPEFALRHLAGSDIDSGTRQSLITNAISSSSGDSEKTARLIELMTSEEDKQFARDQLKLSEIAKSDGAAQKPAEWLDKLVAIDGAKARPYEILNQLRGWDKTKLAELRAGFNALPVEQQQNIGSLVAIGEGYERIDPGFAGDAIRALVTHQTANSDSRRDNDPVMASSNFAVNLSSKDPAAATSWINTLPEGDAKLWARKNVAANWNQYDPKAVTQWLKTLPPTTRDQVTEYLKTRK